MHWEVRLIRQRNRPVFCFASLGIPCEEVRLTWITPEGIDIVPLQGGFVNLTTATSDHQHYNTKFERTMKDIPTLFGSMVFNDTVMQARLLENIYKALKKAFLFLLAIVFVTASPLFAEDDNPRRAELMKNPIFQSSLPLLENPVSLCTLCVVDITKMMILLNFVLHVDSNRKKSGRRTIRGIRTVFGG